MKKLFLRISAILFFLVAIFFVGRIFIRYPFSNDSYLQMGVGKYIVSNQRIPSQSDISFKKSLPVFEFIPHSWLSDIIFYEVDHVGAIGSPLLLILTMAASVWIIFQILSLINAPWQLRLTTIGISLLISPVFYKIHPFIFGILLLLIIVRLHIGWLKGEKNLIFFLPLVFLAFANLAGGYIFIPGLFVLIILIMETISVSLRLTDIKRFLKLLISIVVSFFASLINPLIFRIWLYALTFYIVFSSPNKEVSQLAYTLKLINQNYLKENVSSSLYLIFLLYLLVTVGAFLVLLIKDGGKFLKKNFHYIPYLLLFIFPLIWIRFIPMITFMTLPLFVSLVIYLEDQSKSEKFFLLKMASILGLLFVAVYLIFNPPSQLEFNPPKTQINLINKYNLPDNILTSFDITGYKFFNNIGQKSFIDARDDLFDENETIDLYAYSATVPNNYLANMLAANNINTVIAAQDTESLIQPLAADNSWAIIYLDYNGILFVKKNLLPPIFLDNYSLKYVDLTRKLGFDPQKSVQAAAELKLFTDRYPSSILAIGQLASIYRIEGHYNLAEKTLLRIPKSQWNYIIKIEMGRIKAAEGLCVDSEKYLLDALKERHEQFFSRAILDLAVLYAGCFGDKNKSQHYFQRYISFPIDRQERELVRELAQQFGITIDNSN